MGGGRVGGVYERSAVRIGRAKTSHRGGKTYVSKEGGIAAAK